MTSTSGQTSQSISGGRAGSNGEAEMNVALDAAPVRIETR